MKQNLAETPLQFRPTKKQEAKIATLTAKTGVVKADLVRLAVERFLEEHKTPEAVITAFLRGRVTA